MFSRQHWKQIASGSLAPFAPWPPSPCSCATWARARCSASAIIASRVIGGCVIRAAVRCALLSCLAARPVWVGGSGDRLEPAAGMPRAGIVLANPRRELPTAEVFRQRRGPFGETGRFAPIPHDPAGLAAALAARGNDLTEAAVRLVPEIAAVLDRLAALPGALLARMSGSGATCFALFADRDAARAAGAALAAAEPGWWTASGMLLPPALPPVATQIPRPKS